LRAGALVRFGGLAVFAAGADFSFLICLTSATDAAAFAAAPGLVTRGWNSKPILPPGVFTRKALKGRPFLEMKRGSRSVRPVARSFCSCAR